MLHKTLLVIIAMCCCYHICTANTFIVTSNADSGPGTLRDALLNAAANGTATADSIVFNMPDLSTNGRTINLQSELPALSSNLVIDGTTQAGTAFGISDAKVKLYLDHYTSPAYFTCLLIQDATNVQIYGLFLDYFTDPRSIEDLYGIRIKNSSNIIIGAKGKGNVINKWFWNITNSYWNYFTDNSNTISIKGNMIGVTEMGTVTLDESASSILLNTTYNVEIGGTDPGDGNLIDGLYNSIDLTHADPNIPGSFFTKINNNKIQVDPTGTQPLGFGTIGTTVTLVGSGVIGADSLIPKTEISNNVISGSGEQINMDIHNIGHLIKIMGNKIGTDITGANQIGVSVMGIQIENCNKVWVGSDNDADKNYFAGNSIGIFYASSKALITKNSFFCNGKGISIGAYNGQKPFVTMNTYTSSVISGQANPFARIELFQNINCTSFYVTSCQGKIYLATVFADANGSWSYTGPQQPSMIVTATTTDSSTSEFPVPLVSTDPPLIKNASCGKNNGSITGIKIISGTNFNWVGPNGFTDNTDTNLLHIGPGNYTLNVSFGENGCTQSSATYQIANVQPPPSVASYSVSNTTCGQSNGSINISGDFSNFNVKWTNAFGDSVGNAQFVSQLSNGNYYFKVWAIQDSTCSSTFGPYNIINQSGPSLNTNNIQINQATCNQPNGGISNIQFSNITGTATYNWYDSLNHLVGTSPDLSDVGAGKYTLKFKDGSGCDTIVASFFVANNGAIQINASAKTITPCSCAGTTGAIKNITIQNGSSYIWIDSITRNIVGNNADLINVPSGYYKLIATSSSGCMDSTATFYIPQAEITTLSVSSLTVHQESCGQKNASGQINTIDPTPVGYTFEWVDSATQQIIATGLSIKNVPAGEYYFYATDSNGCKQLVTSFTFINEPAPVINESSAKISPDICEGSTGSITQIATTGSSPFAYSWFNEAGILIAQTTDLTNAAAGNYYLVVTDANTCSDTSSVFAIKDTTGTINLPQYNTITVLKGTDATLQVNNPEKGIYYLFSSNLSNIPDQQDSSGTFITSPLNNDTTVYVSLKKGSCESDKTPVFINQLENFSLNMPNAFTPNGDGHNDLFKVKYPQLITKFQMAIFNRWGQKVFETTDSYKGWDGTLNGNKQPTGNYIWIIYYEDILGNKKKISGNTILIR